MAPSKAISNKIKKGAHRMESKKRIPTHRRNPASRANNSQKRTAKSLASRKKTKSRPENNRLKLISRRAMKEMRNSRHSSRPSTLRNWHVY